MARDLQHWGEIPPASATWLEPGTKFSLTGARAASGQSACTELKLSKSTANRAEQRTTAGIARYASAQGTQEGSSVSLCWNCTLRGKEGSNKFNGHA